MLPRCFLVFLLFLLLFGAGDIRAQESRPAEIAGFYYFKGLNLLEIRVEGDQAIIEASGEREWLRTGLEALSDPSSPGEESQRKIEPRQHGGRLVSPQSIDAGSFDLSLDHLLRHFHFSEEDLPPHVKPTLQQIFANQKNLGKYFERWNLLPDGRLEIDGALPVFHSALLLSSASREEGVKIRAFIGGLKGALGSPAQTGRDVPAEFRQANPGLCKRVCGWKVTHLGEIQGWKALEAGQYAQAADFFRKAAEAQPGSPFPFLGEAWARGGLGEFDAARQILQTGAGLLTPEMRPFLEPAIFLIENQIYSAETIAHGPNADYMALVETFESRWPPETRKPETIRKFSGKKAHEIRAEEYPEIQDAVGAFPLWADLQKTGGMRGRGPLLTPGPKAFMPEFRRQIPFPNYLTHRNLAVMVILSGHLWRAQGQFSPAIYQYAAAVRLGQMVRQGLLLSHLIGISMEQMGVNALLDLFEDGFIRDGATLQYMTEMTDFLTKNEPRPDGRMLAYEITGYPTPSNPILEYIFLLSFESLLLDSFEESQIREKVLEARFAVLRAACILKRQALAAPFPSRIDPALLPPDPFAPGEKIRYIFREGSDRATLYSIGPDGRDQGTTIRYDPTNGAGSAGDIYLRTQ